MQELAPGLWHWTARHPCIHIEVSSHYLEPERVLIDAMVPPGGMDWLEEHGPPEHIVLSNRHHDRQSWSIHDEFGATVHCVRNGLYELEGRGPVEPFDFEDELPGGIIVHEIGAICPDESALHIPKYRALACADGVVRFSGTDELGFVPDDLMDDPEETKQHLLEAYGRMLELDFDLLLLAHGVPIARGGKEALRAFVRDAG